MSRLRCYWLGLRYGIWPQWLVKLRMRAHFRLLMGGNDMDVLEADRG